MSKRKCTSASSKEPLTKMLNNDSVTINSLPSETLIHVFLYLAVVDKKSFRLVSKRFASIGENNLITTVQIYLSPQALARLEAISKHPTISKHVTAISFQATVLADKIPEKRYASILEREIASGKFCCPIEYDRLKSPPRDLPAKKRGAWKRAEVRRLKSQTQQQISSLHKQYRTFYQTQQALLKDETLRFKIGMAVRRFSKLRDIRVMSHACCSHMLPSQYREEIAVDCNVPIQKNIPGLPPTNFFLPLGQPLIGLEHLEMGSVRGSDLFIKNADSSDQTFQNLQSVFSSLKFLALDFNHCASESGSVVFFNDYPLNRMIENGQLSALLGAAPKLEVLNLSFEDEFMPTCNDSILFSKTLKDNVWNNLAKVSLVSVAFQEEEFMTFLKAQPKLDGLAMRDVCLAGTNDTWASLIERIPRELPNLQLVVGSYLQDKEKIWDTDLVSSELLEDMCIETLSDAISCYVENVKAWIEDSDCDMEFRPANPFTDCDWADIDEVDSNGSLRKEIYEIDEISSDSDAYSTEGENE